MSEWAQLSGVRTSPRAHRPLPSRAQLVELFLIGEDSNTMDASEGQDAIVYLRLSRAEALVLFEWLHRHEDEDVRLDRLVEDPAERVVLWSLSGALEALLPEPFALDYADRLEAARAALRPGGE